MPYFSRKVMLMRTVFLFIGWMLVFAQIPAQPLQQRLSGAVQALENDPQLEHGLLSLVVANSNTGQILYNHNGHLGLPAASSQKVITAATALELLGSEYRFKTQLAYTGSIVNGTLQGNLYLIGFGDPTLGSWRWPQTKPEIIIQQWTQALLAAGIRNINGTIYLDDHSFGYQPLPGGYTWNDMGNYYGSGHWGLNWHENQYDLILQPGRATGDPVTIVRTEPKLQIEALYNQLRTGPAGSGDQAVIFLPPYGTTGFVTGTVPAGVANFTISGAFPNPLLQIQHELGKALKQNNIGGIYHFERVQHFSPTTNQLPVSTQTLHTTLSPGLDSIVYWFLRKSVNLYGEALVRTLGYRHGKAADYVEGLQVVTDFWSKLGISKHGLRMQDGSGLSPQNRITGEGFVKILQWARGRGWFKFFYDALPVYNGIKMKSGTIGGVKSFTGYIRSTNGTEWTFAINVNNYTGSPQAIVNKIYQLLDVLK